MDYFVSFNGYLVERTRPDGWPKVVRDKFVYRAERVEKLIEGLNGKAKEYQTLGGMNIVFDQSEEKEIEASIALDCGEQMKTDPLFGKGFFVPMHMIAFINYTIRPLSGVVTSPEDVDPRRLI